MSPGSIDLGAYRAESRARWGDAAAGWEHRSRWFARMTAPVTAWLVEHTDPQPGETFLDLAAGPGEVGFAVAESLGATGRLISGDFAPEMVAVARRAGAARGLANVDYRLLDAERLDLPDDSVDGVVSRWGYMLLADPAAALLEARRVLRDDGRLAFSVWRGPEQNPWAALPALTLVERGHTAPPEPGTPGIFALADPVRTRQLVRDAGFAEPEVEDVSFEFRYADVDDLWDSFVRMSGHAAHAIAGLDDDERAATRAAVAQALLPYRRNDGSYVAPASTWAVLAR
jgi:SAM-dependent methyltransferase